MRGRNMGGETAFGERDLIVWYCAVTAVIHVTQRFAVSERHTIRVRESMGPQMLRLHASSHQSHSNYSNYLSSLCSLPFSSAQLQT